MKLMTTMMGCPLVVAWQLNHITSNRSAELISYCANKFLMSV